MNTVINTEGVGNINSKNYWGYALQPFDHASTEFDDEFVRGHKLIACFGEPNDNHNPKNIVIAVFFIDKSNEACSALASLLDAIKRGAPMWDVCDHKSKP